MTHAKDYIEARHQVARNSMPGLKVKLEKLIDESKADFIENGNITITDVDLAEEIHKFRSQSTHEGVNELCDWLKRFGWDLLYRLTDPRDENSPKVYFLSPTDESRK